MERLMCVYVEDLSVIRMPIRIYVFVREEQTLASTPVAQVLPNLAGGCSLIWQEIERDRNAKRTSSGSKVRLQSQPS